MFLFGISKILRICRFFVGKLEVLVKLILIVKWLGSIKFKYFVIFEGFCKLKFMYLMNIFLGGLKRDVNKII